MLREQERKRKLYTKLKELGSGTFGTVYLVAKSSGEHFVMKEVSLRGLPSKEIRSTMNEVSVLQKLSHDHVVSYVDSFVVEGHDPKLCIVMEWASGGDLSALISRRKKKGVRFTESEVIHLLQQICSGLKYCHHDLKLLHRDLKPANIFLDANGSIKLGDFGISKVLPTSGALAATRCGSPLYMSPEMARGEAYTQAADAWAVGCILYELMALRAPWVDQLGPHEQRAGIPGLLRVISGGRLNTEYIRGHYSDELCAMLCALVTRDPNKRPSCASILDWPIMRRHAPPAPAPPPPTMIQRLAVRDAPAGADAHAAAEAIQRSFRDSLGRQPRERQAMVDDRLRELQAHEAMEETLVLRPPEARAEDVGGVNAAAAAYTRRAAQDAACATRGDAHTPAARAFMMAAVDGVNAAFAKQPPYRAPGMSPAAVAPASAVEPAGRVKPVRAANPSVNCRQPPPATRMPAAPIPLRAPPAAAPPHCTPPAKPPRRVAPSGPSLVRASSAVALDHPPGTVANAPAVPRLRPMSAGVGASRAAAAAAAARAAAAKAAVLANHHFANARAQRAVAAPLSAAPVVNHDRAAAAQKIIDSFKRSLERREANGPTRRPTPQQRQTLNRRCPKPSAQQCTPGDARLGWPSAAPAARPAPPPPPATRVPLATPRRTSAVSDLKLQFEPPPAIVKQRQPPSSRLVAFPVRA